MRGLETEFSLQHLGFTFVACTRQQNLNPAASICLARVSGSPRGFGPAQEITGDRFREGDLFAIQPAQGQVHTLGAQALGRVPDRRGIISFPKPNTS